ncbi:MAG: hypothetical protein AB7N71_03975 [Phycisphaerae bacterium]
MQFRLTRKSLRRFFVSAFATTAMSLVAAPALAQDSRVVVLDERNLNQQIPLQQNQKVGNVAAVNLAGRGPVLVIRIDAIQVPSDGVFTLPNGSTATFKNSTDANGVSKEFSFVEVQDAAGNTRWQVNVTIKRNGSIIGTGSSRLPAGTTRNGAGFADGASVETGGPAFQPPGTFVHFPGAMPMPPEAEAELLADLGLPDLPFTQVWDLPAAHYLQGVIGSGIDMVEVQGAGPWGDMNCDGAVSVADIGPYVMALTNPDEFAATFPDCPRFAADMNEDGVVTVGDIGHFVAALTGS